MENGGISTAETAISVFPASAEVHSVETEQQKILPLAATGETPVAATSRAGFQAPTSMETATPEIPTVEEPPIAAPEPTSSMPLDLTATDLVQIETNPEKSRSVPDYDEPPQPRPLRVRPAASLTEDEPLEQVETRK